MSIIEQKIRISIKKAEKCTNPNEYHIKKSYTYLIHRGLEIIQVINTREKKFLTHYIPEDITFIFDSYAEADLCARIMKSYYNSIDKKWR